MYREHPSLSLVRQCALLGVSRSNLCYRPRAASVEDLSLMGEIDRQYLETPFYGSRKMKAWLERRGIQERRDSHLATCPKFRVHLRGCRLAGTARGHRNGCGRLGPRFR